MSFRPFGRRHAIQEVVFVLNVSRQIAAAEIEAFHSAHDRWRTELPKVNRPSVFQFFVGSSPAGAPVPPQSVAPVLFQSFKRDGTLEWQLQANDNWLAVNCLSYSRWDATYQQARSLLERGYDSLGDSRPEITNVALQYIDTFVWEGPPDEYDVEELINRESGFFPDKFRPRGPLWHFHEGQIEAFGENALPLLNRSHIDAVTQQDRFETRIDTMLTMDVPLDALGADRNFEVALNAFEGLHQRNKEILSEVISPAMQEQISLHGGRSE